MGSWNEQATTCDMAETNIVGRIYESRFVVILLLATFVLFAAIEAKCFTQKAGADPVRENASIDDNDAPPGTDGCQKALDDKSRSEAKGVETTSEKAAGNATNSTGSGAIYSKSDAVLHMSPLHFACKEGNLDAVKMLISHGADIEARDIFGRTPLYDAIACCHIDVVECLLKDGAQINIRDGEDITPLECAAHVIAHQYLACVEIEDLTLLRHTFEEIRDLLMFWGAEYTLRAAVMAGDMNRVQELVRADPECLTAARPDRSGVSLLQRAAVGGYEELVRLLLAHGFLVDERGDWDLTASQLAVGLGHENVVAALIEKGADVNAADSDGNTPLHVAAECGSSGVARLLLSKGAEVNAESRYGITTPLHEAMLSRNRELVEVLLDAGASVNEQDAVGFTPLHYLALGREEGADGGGLDAQERETILGIAELLVARGTIVDITNEAGLTPIDLARRQGTVFLAEFLEKRVEQIPSKKPE